MQIEHKNCFEQKKYKNEEKYIKTQIRCMSFQCSQQRTINVSKKTKNYKIKVIKSRRNILAEQNMLFMTLNTGG